MSSAYIIVGSFAFLIFILYDINSIRFKSRLLKPAFFLGFLLLIAATIMMFAAGWEAGETSRIRQIAFMVLGAVFLLLLVYTLFFALPFGDTYVKEGGRPVVYSSGMYALCRHPGVLWFACMYACFAVAMPTRTMITGGIVFSLWNILYVIMQDVWTFPNYFFDYTKYKAAVPFLIPTIKSSRACISTMRAGRKHV